MAANDNQEEFTYNLWSKKPNSGYIFCEKAGPKYYAVKDAGGYYNVKKLSTEEVIIQPQYDAIYSIHEAGFVVVRTNKIGIVNLNNDVVVPLEYDDITGHGGNYTLATKIVGLHKNNIWEYFDLENLNKEPILKSEHKCYILEGLALKMH